MYPLHSKKCDRRPRRGLTLVELLMTIVVMSLIALAMGMLATAVESGNEYTLGNGTATQHARVVLNRISHNVTTATANAGFPGFAVFSEQIDGWEFPDTLVVWHPEGAATSPDGLPRFDELVIYAPDPAAPHNLLEISVPGDPRVVPPLSNVAAWRNELDAIKLSVTAERTVLTDRLRTAKVYETDPVARGVVRFTQRVLPSAADWSNYQAGTLAWGDLPWVQDIHGTSRGLRQSWCRVELQLAADERAAEPGRPAVPFFGSAALYYELAR